MAKKIIDLTKFSLFAAKPVVKQAPETRQTESVLEEAVKEIHQEEPPKTAKPAPTSKPAAEEPRVAMGRPSTRDRANTVRLSIDLPKPLAKQAKRRIIDLEMTMIEYVTQLIEKDLEE